MGEYPQYNKEDSGLAALGYIPFFFISIIVPIYVLLKKEGKYVRFHAAQSLVLTIALFIINTILSIIAMVLFFLVMGATLASTQDASLGFLAMYSSMFVAMIPSMIFSLIILLFELYLAFAALNGNRVNIPFITGFVLEKFN